MSLLIVPDLAETSTGANSAMKIIKFECPHCHETVAGDESSLGQQVICPKCQGTMLVPQPPVSAPPPTAQLIEESGGAFAGALDEAIQEIEVFKVSPAARAYPG
jgi:predicted RNA-binding Zn-ribbon protein involved in translation (DUF1610 family)